jgi:hypothetical protein
MSFRTADKAPRQPAGVMLGVAAREAKVPVGTSVGRIKGKAGEAFRRPVRLPWRFPIVALSAHESRCLVPRFSNGVASNDTTRPRPTRRGAVSNCATMSLGK